MKRSSLPFGLVVVSLALMSKAADGGTDDDARQAMASVQDAIPRAQADSTRPVYHFRPPANWMNDPNGPIYHRGFYHLFYQHNPYGDRWGHMHWGHARSRDLVHWEHLPIALQPSKEAGEDHVFSGCAVINGLGEPMIIYTSIGRGKPASEYAEQWAAIGDRDLLNWRKHPANPVLGEPLHGNTKIYDWRDPFIFQHQGRNYLVLGGNLNRGAGGQAVVNLYEAGNAELTQWKYLGVLFTHPDPKVANIECPNFFPLGQHWVLVISPHRPVEYFIGDFDAAARQFKPQHHGLMDHSGNYYAPNSLLDPKDRRIIWGWIRGFKNGLGWNGCLTLPRVLTLEAGTELRQEPAPEIKKLRGSHFRQTKLRLSNTTNVLEQVHGGILEILAEFDPGGAKTIGLQLRRSADGQRSVEVAFDGSQLVVADAKAPLRLRAGEKTLKLHVFLDQSVIEIFANDRTCVSRVMDAAEKDLGVAAFAAGGSASIKTLDVWQMKSIW